MEKQQKRPQIAGVYRIYDPVGGESFVGYSYNVLSTFNRYKLEFAMNACTFRALQQFWNDHNGQVEMEILEKLSVSGDTEPDPETLEDALQVMARYYAQRLGEKAHLMQVDG